MGRHLPQVQVRPHDPSPLRRANPVQAELQRENLLLEPGLPSLHPPPPDRVEAEPGRATALSCAAPLPPALRPPLPESSPSASSSANARRTPSLHLRPISDRTADSPTVQGIQGGRLGIAPSLSSARSRAVSRRDCIASAHARSSSPPIRYRAQEKPTPNRKQ